MFDSEKLILEVQLRPCLWNIGDGSYSNRTARKSAWEQIAQEFNEDWSTYSTKKKNETIDDLQKKWKHLRDYYTKEKKKNNLKSGSSAPAKKRNTPYYEMLIFLDVTLQCRNTDSSFTEDESSNRNATPPPPTATPPPSNQHELSASEYKKITPFQKSVLKKMAKKSQDDDPDIFFLLSLLPDMKTMKDSEKFEFKFEIMSAIKRIKYSSHISLSPTPSTNEYHPNSITPQRQHYQYRPSSIASTSNSSENFGYSTRTRSYLDDFEVDLPNNEDFEGMLQAHSNANQHDDDVPEDESLFDAEG